MCMRFKALVLSVDNNTFVLFFFGKIRSEMNFIHVQILLNDVFRHIFIKVFHLKEDEYKEKNYLIIRKEHFGFREID